MNQEYTTPLARRLRHCARRIVPAAIAVAALGCSHDIPAVNAVTGLDAGRTTTQLSDAIVVGSSAELAAALSPVNAGRRIHVRAGTYHLTTPLLVPDNATLEGEGVMQFDGGGLPTGFASGSRTTLVMVAGVPGDVLTLGDGATVRRLAIEDLPGRPGNGIGIVSRAPGDAVAATIDETEIVVPSAHGVAPQGPTGCGIAVVSRNPNMGAEPAAHTGATLDTRITHTIVRAPATGIGCGLFAFNFAARGSVHVALARNVIGGGIIASGGVSRPDMVHDATTVIASRNNHYRDDTADACVSRRLGWNLQGGAGVPVPMPNPGATGNVLRVHSTDDRIDGFVTGVLATGGRRFFGAPLGGPVSGNHLDLQLIGTTITTPACGGMGTDLRMAGGLVTSAGTSPGDDNTVHAVLRGVTGSGERTNVFANVLGPAGPQSPAASGSGNRLTFGGSPTSFARVNSAVSPAPGAEFFTGGGL